MNVSFITNVQFSHLSSLPSIPKTRIPRRHRLILHPRRHRLIPQRIPSRSLHCGCFLKSSTTQNETRRNENSVQVGGCPPTYISARGKVIAIGDLHGDLRKTIRALELANVIRQGNRGLPEWNGGNTVVVQLGDVLDRGDCEIGILMLLRELHDQAKNHGGGVYTLNGNHESLNVCGNFRYVTPGAFSESQVVAGMTGKKLSFNWEDQVQARMSLYSPGGLLACELAKNPTVLVVNDTIFAHGGLLPVHVNYGLERINQEMSAWMKGDITPTGSKSTPPYIAMGGPNSILWNRTLGQERFDTSYDKYYACSMVKSVLKKVKAKRLVLGHTPQITGCNSECDGQLWRADVGMSKGVLNAEPQVLTIDKNQSGETQIKVIRSKPRNLSLVRQPKKSSNIQRALGFGVSTISVQHKKIKWMSETLVSKVTTEV
eukprot:g2247.t1